MANFVDYPGDFRLQTGDLEKRFKIWSLPDYPGELTALQLFHYKEQQQALFGFTTGHPHNLLLYYRLLHL